MSPVTAVTTAWRRVVSTVLEYLSRLKPEKVDQFQSMYYVVFMLTAVLILIPGVPTQGAVTTMKPEFYHALIVCTFAGPAMSLLGRRLMARGVGAQGRSGLDWPGALLRFVGDGVVFGSVVLWFAAVLHTAWWSQWLIVVAVMMMCVLGGAMFTARSAVRVAEVKGQEWREALAKRRMRRRWQQRT